MDKPINIRLSQEMVDTLDSLSERLQSHPDLALRGTVNRSRLIRECLLRCIPELERMAKEYRNHGA